MKFNEGTFYATLVTIGRKSGKEHSVELKAVFYKDKFYFSRRNPNSDWLKNVISTPHVKVKFDGKTLTGTASLVDDEQLARKISQLKYTDKRAEDFRVVVQVTLCE